MPDSNVRDRLDAKHDGDRERHIAAIKRWVAYIESEPLEMWGPQQNTIVDDQLETAQDTNTSAAHQQRVRDVAAAIIEERDAHDHKSTLSQGRSMRMKLLRASIDRDPPEPRLKAKLPSDEEFYDGEVPVWQSGETVDDEDTEPTLQ